MPAKVTPERLADMLDTGAESALLDTRPEESYEADSDHEKPPNYEEVIAVNLGTESADADEATELEMGPNRCSA